MDPVKLAKAEYAASEWEEANQLTATGEEDRRPELAFATFPVKKFRSAVSPDCSFRLLRDTLKSGKDDGEILLYIYNITAAHLVDVLMQRLAAGVTVRIMWDAIDVNGGEREKIEMLEQAGAETKKAPSTGARRVFPHCHQKFVVVDGRTIALGSANWAGTAVPNVTTPGVFKKGNREWLVRLDDGDVAEWFRTLFDADWNVPELELPPGAVGFEAEQLEPVPMPALLFQAPDDVYDIEVFDLAQAVDVTPVVSPDNYFDEVKALIDSATSSIYIQQQYILAGGKVNELLSAVEKKRKNDGVEVRIIVSPAFRKVGKKDNWEISRETLDAFDLKDCLRALNLEYFIHCHNKGLIVDRSKVVVSSTNWSRNSVEKAREAGVLIDSEEVAEYYAKVFDTDWEDLSWAEEDVPDNLLKLAAESLFAPGGIIEVEPGELI